MKGVSGDEKGLCKVLVPSFADEFKECLRVFAVDFVADDRVAERCEVDADLVEASGDGLSKYEGESLTFLKGFEVGGSRSSLFFDCLS